MAKVGIYKYGFLNQFVDLIQLFELKTDQKISYKIGIEEIKIFQNYLEEFIDFILLLNYNLNFLHLNKLKDNNDSIQKMLQSFIQEMSELKLSFIDSCIEYFNELIKVNKYNNTSEKLPEDFHIIFVNKKKFLNEANKYYSRYEKLRQNIEEKIKLYPLQITSKILFPIVGALYNSK